jgi:hypothetical protein
MPNPKIKETIAFVEQILKERNDCSYSTMSSLIMFENINERTVDILNYVVKNCGVPIARLTELGYDKEIVESVEYLSKWPEELDEYEKEIDRIKHAPVLAHQVKLVRLVNEVMNLRNRNSRK